MIVSPFVVFQFVHMWSDVSVIHRWEELLPSFTRACHQLIEFPCWGYGPCRELGGMTSFPCVLSGWAGSVLFHIVSDFVVWWVERLERVMLDQSECVWEPVPWGFKTGMQVFLQMQEFLQNKNFFNHFLQSFSIFLGGHSNLLGLQIAPK